MMRPLVVFASLLQLAVPAGAVEVKSCEDANVGLTALIAPVAKNSRTFKDDRVSIYAVDTVEPVCCASGVAIVLPDITDEAGGSRCFAAVGVASVQLDELTSEDDPAKGLLVSIPTRVYGEAADSAPGAPLKLRINIENGTVVAE
ncbi:MAG: hypothetical protein WC829_07860 [Hyphomicrobium sp.]